MQTRWAVLLMAGLAGCVAGTGPQASNDTAVETYHAPPPGYPPRIGMLATHLNEQAEIFETYDYSIGAYDASVQVYNFNGEIRFSLMAEQIGRPQGKDAKKVYVKAVMRDQTQTGSLADPVIEIISGEQYDGPRLTSVGPNTSVVLDSLTPMGPQGEYGHVRGHLTALLCAATGQPARVDRSECKPFDGSFESDLQIGGP